MKIFVLAALALAVSASASFAEETRPAPLRETVVAANTVSNAPRAAAGIGRDGQNPALRCPAEDTNIDYRNCVNASTRDPNAKIRLG